LQNSQPVILQGEARMDGPTQEIIVAAVRRQGRVHVADVLRMLGPGVASLVPEEIQRMKESGLVVYDEPLGPDALLRLP
jgi:hypothetical protein